MRIDEFEYRGINSRKDLELIVGHVSMPIAPTISESVIDIPMKYGNEFLGTAYGSKSIDIPITALPGGSYERYMEIIENLTNVFVDNDPDDIGLEFPLRFGFRPEVTYYGHFTNIPTPTFISEGVFDFTTTLTFVMSDPRGCLPQLEQSLKGTGANSVSVPGSANAEPVIHIIPKRNLMYFGYNLNGGVFGVGPDSSEEVSQAVVAQTNKVMSDDAATLAMWSTDADAIGTMRPNGDVKFQGNLQTDSSRNSIFVKTDKNNVRQFGDVVNTGWYGPAARHQGLSESLSDFKVVFRMHHQKFRGQHNGRAMARVESFLLDPNGQIIGRFAIVDPAFGVQPECYVQIGTPGTRFDANDGTHHTFFGASDSRKFTVNHPDQNFKVTLSSKVVETKQKVKGKGKNSKTTVVTKKETVKKTASVVNKDETNVFSDFWGEFTLEKKGNTWKWSISQLDLNTGRAYVDRSGRLFANGSWIDSKNQFSNLRLGSVGFMMVKHSISEDRANPQIKYHDPYLSITDVQVWKLNKVDETKPQVVAYAGSEIIINTEQETVTVEDKMVYPVWSTDWPRLKPGNNYLQFSGDVGDAKIVMEYVPRVK